MYGSPLEFSLGTFEGKVKLIFMFINFIHYSLDIRYKFVQVSHEVVMEINPFNESIQ